MAAEPGGGGPALVVGARGVGKRTLLASLDARSAGSGAYALRLDTKYYTADVLVRALDVDARVSDSRDDLQALLLVLDAGSVDSYKALLGWHEKHQELCDCDIKLLVANKADALQGQQQEQEQRGAGGAGPSSASSPPAWLEEARSWCYANGFEYITAAAGAPAVDVALHEEGEQQGVARVLAALQAHMWPGMVQKKPRQGEGRGQGGSAGRPAAAGSGGGAGGSRDQGPGPSSSVGPSPHQQAEQEQQQRRQQPAGGGACSAASGLHEKDAASTQKHGSQQQQGAGPAGPPAQPQQPHAAAGDGAAVPNAVSAGDGAAAAEDDDPFLGAEVDDFEALMGQVMGVRARLAGLPDEERRTAAAEFALKLSRMMGLGEEDDDDEEDGASGDDQGEGPRAAVSGRAGPDASCVPDAGATRAPGE